ncbi:MAG TPA: SDR family oxidoreductase [Candidatus Solibacter sp.]|nr:SDR family oxidoreductase [Candidatus Solibacter sp.]
MEARSLSLKNTPKNSNGFRLDGRKVIVTGGASGIGRAIAQRFAASGAHVFVLDIRAKEADETVREILDAGGQASAHVCDVTNQEEVRAVFRDLAQRGRIDTLVNNAGISHIGKLDTTSERDFERVFQVNVKGFYNCMLAAVEHMKANGGGVILNMASIAGSSGLADRFAYSTSKGAVIAMTYSVAKDYLDFNIRCNCISPARVHTPFVDGYLRQNYPGKEAEMFGKLSNSQPLGRMAEPQEVAALALYLCSDEASFLTGVDYPIDGGFFNLRG